MAHHCVYHSEHDLFWNTGLKKDMNMKMTLRSPRAGVVVERFGDKRKYLYKIVENNPVLNQTLHNLTSPGRNKC